MQVSVIISQSKATCYRIITKNIWSIKKIHKFSSGQHRVTQKFADFYACQWFQSKNAPKPLTQIPLFSAFSCDHCRLSQPMNTSYYDLQMFCKILIWMQMITFQFWCNPSHTYEAVKLTSSNKLHWIWKGIRGIKRSVWFENLDRTNHLIYHSKIHAYFEWYCYCKAWTFLCTT